MQVNNRSKIEKVFSLWTWLFLSEESLFITKIFFVCLFVFVFNFLRNEKVKKEQKNVFERMS